MRHKAVIIVSLLMFGLLFMVNIVSAQPPPPPPQDIPIDGGLSVLLAAGLLYGAREIYRYDKKRRKK